MGFHISTGRIRHVIIAGTKAAPVYLAHGSTDLVLLSDRRQFTQNAKNSLMSEINKSKPDRLAYVLSMNAKSKDQIAALIFPAAILNHVGYELGLECHEYIAQNFGKSFFKGCGHAFNEKYSACDSLIGTHPPKWADQDRLAALAAIGSL